MWLDTNIVSELRKGKRAHPGVQSWFASTDQAKLFTSVLVLGEIRRGIEQLRRRDPMAAASLDRWLLLLASGFEDRVLPVDAEVSDRWGRLNVPVSLPAVDSLLAATALVHGLTLVTRNVRDVERTGAAVFDPFA